MLKRPMGPDDAYGLTTEELRACLLRLTGSEHGANDAMAGVAEWLDTARGDIPAYADATSGDLTDAEREKVVAVVSGFVTALSMAAEGSVTEGIEEGQGVLAFRLA